MGSLYRSQHELVLVFKHGRGGHRNNVQLGQFGRRCELVSAAGSDSAPYEFLESIKKEGRNAAMPCHLSLVIKINFTWL